MYYLKGRNFVGRKFGGFGGFDKNPPNLTDIDYPPN